jgi:hypothetical protein
LHIALMPKRKSTGRSKSIAVACGACQLQCYVEVPVNFSARQVKRETLDFILCPECCRAIELEGERDPRRPFVVFTSHINQSVVQHSSHPNIVHQSPYLSFSKRLFTSSDGDINLVRNDWFRRAKAILIVAGAGMSADSGLSTFRYRLDTSDLGEEKRLLGGGLTTAEVS